MNTPAIASSSEARRYPTKPAAVYLFATCLVDQFTPAAGMDTIKLLEREGIRVEFPLDQTCCGQPAYSSGYPEQARVVARRQLELFPEDWPIVVPSGSCAGMMRHHYPKLFAEEPVLLAKAKALAERIFEFSEFLVHVLGFNRPDLGAPCTVAVHTSCAARREMNTHITGRALVTQLAKVKLTQHDHESECCGFGGTFSLRHPEISAAMVADKVASIKASGAQAVVSADCGCMLNILSHAAHAQADHAALPGEHLASFLWKRTNQSDEPGAHPLPSPPLPQERGDSTVACRDLPTNKEQA